MLYRQEPQSKLGLELAQHKDGVPPQEHFSKIFKDHNSEF